MRGFHTLFAIASVVAVGCSGEDPARSDAETGESSGGMTGDGSTSGGAEDPASGCMPGDAAVVSPLRRLTRTELANTLRDLTGADPAVVEGMTADEKLGPFDANLVPITELTVEQVAEIAETTAAALTDQAALALLPCGDASCADALVESFGRRAFRRPLTAEELEAYAALQAEGVALGGEPEGVRLVVEAMLQSPSFLYHVESLGEGWAGYARASRLSYLLWSSMPDDALLDAAAAGELDDAQGMAEHATRMLDDARARDALASFHVQWLGLDRLDAVEKDPATLASFDDEIRQAMVDELVGFVDHVLRRGDGRLHTLLTSSYKLPAPALWEIYGIEGVDDNGGHDFGDERPGILTHAGVMALLAHPSQSSPILRGTMIREDVLCQDLAPPPQGVVTDPPVAEPGETTRQAFERITGAPECAACHTLINPLGYPFESYDAVGRFRREENGSPIDASGEISGTEQADQGVADVGALVDALASTPEVQACVARQWLRFALPQPPSEAMDCTVEELAAQLASGDGRVEDLLLAIVQHEAFMTIGEVQ